MQFIDLARSRYSCRAFSEKPVETEKLDLILEAGRLAPTATNAQPVRVLVLKSEAALTKMRGLTRMTYNACMTLARARPLTWLSGRVTARASTC